MGAHQYWRVAGGGVPKEGEKGALMWQVFPYLLDSENLDVRGHAPGM